MIDYFHPWSPEALVSVAQHFLEDVEFAQPELRDNIAFHVAEVHSSVNSAAIRFKRKLGRYYYTTPKSFLELIEFYKALLLNERENMANAITRLETGLSTLEKTNRDVAALKENLKVQMIEVEHKKEATDALLEEMGQRRTEAENRQLEADKERMKANDAAEKASKVC